MPAELLTKNGRVTPEALPARKDELRYWARRHVERVRRVKLHIGAFILGMAVLTPSGPWSSGRTTAASRAGATTVAPASGSPGFCTSP